MKKNKLLGQMGATFIGHIPIGGFNGDMPTE